MNSRIRFSVRLILLALVCLGVFVRLAQFAIPHNSVLAESSPAVADQVPSPSSKTNYILTEDALYSLARRNDAAAVSALRAHAWQMLYSLLSSSGSPASLKAGTLTGQPMLTNSGFLPAWEQSPWVGKCDVGLTNNACPHSPAASAAVNPATGLQRLVFTGMLDVPAQTVLMGESPRPNAKLFNLSSALYNPAAQDFVSDNKLTELATWSGSLPPPLPHALKPAALIVKEIWETVPACHPGQTCPQAIATWDRARGNFPKSSAYSKDTSIQLPPLRHWPNQPFVDANPEVPCNPTDYPPATTGSRTHPIPIQCFHFLKYDGNQLPLNIRSDHVKFAPRDPSFIILIGFHVMSGEVRNWTWSTFWWTGQPSLDPKANDKPDALKQLGAPWNFYAMDTFVSSTNPGPGVAGNPHDHVLFNPYLEGPTPGGQMSNCLYCHSHAVYRSKPTWVPADLETMGIPPATPPDTTYFNNAIQTHFMWGLASHLDQPFNDSGSVLDQLILKSGTLREKTIQIDRLPHD
jgi:hypothetical protein